MKHNINFSIEFRKNILPGKFIALEGIDGSGKTTQAKLLVKSLKKAGFKAIYTHEPTDAPTGKFIKKVLLGELKVPPVALQYLFGADRAVHLEQVENYLKKGYFVVTDRYFWSSVAYGVSDMGQITDFYLTTFSILSFYHRFIVPDCTFFLNVDADTAFKRIEGSPKHRDIYDNPQKLPTIEKSYKALIERFKKSFVMIDGEQSVEKVTEDLLLHIERSIKK